MSIGSLIFVALIIIKGTCEMGRRYSRSASRAARSAFMKKDAGFISLHCISDVAYSFRTSLLPHTNNALIVEVCRQGDVNTHSIAHHPVELHTERNPSPSQFHSQNDLPGEQRKEITPSSRRRSNHAGMTSEQEMHEVVTPYPQMPSNPAIQSSFATETVPQNKNGEDVETGARKDETDEIMQQLSLAKEAIADRDAQIKRLHELDFERVRSFTELQAKHSRDYDRMAKELFSISDDITTIVRVRGTIDTDANQAHADISFPATQSDVIEIRTSRTDLIGKVIPDVRKFGFNHLFDSSASNEDLFERITPAIAAALEGRNLYVMIDGQSNTGKSFTVFTGPHAIAPSAANQIFDRISTLTDQGWVCSVKCSAIENHLGNLKDLLVSNSDSHRSQINIRSAGQAKIEGQVERVAVSAEELAALFETACKNRQVQSTMKNSTSSRSHMVCTLRLTRRHSVTSKFVESTVYFVDLAGSERYDQSSAADPMRNEETKSISDSRTDLHQALRSHRSSRGRVTANTMVGNFTATLHAFVNRIAVSKTHEGNF